MAQAKPDAQPPKRRRSKKPLDTIPELEELSPRRKAFVLNYADPTSPTYGNATRSMVAAGAPDTEAAQVTASRSLSNDKVRTSIAAVFAEAGLTGEFLAQRLKHFVSDSDESWKRAPAVRSSEIIARITGYLGAETQVNAMTVVLSENERSSLEARLSELEAGS